jgi:hypothetical protein
MVSDDTQSDFMAGTHAYAWDDRRTATLSGFLGSKILESNFLLAVANREQHTTPGLLTQEVSRFNNEKHVAIRMMQSLWTSIFTGNSHPALSTRASEQCSN